jgi:threonine dehydrogenase-like Zn-dependent dehydrogenase
MIKPEKFVTDILSLDDLQKAMERQIDPNDKLIKSVIKFN